jgi:hypothetical protein
MPLAPVERTPAFETDNRATIADIKEQGIYARERPAALFLFIPDLNRADRLRGAQRDAGRARKLRAARGDRP